MAKIPVAKYKVKIDNPPDEWANGVLIVEATEGQSTYNGIAVTDGHFHDDDVRWHVELEHEGALCHIHFRGGKYKDKKIKDGKVTSKCFKGKSGGDPEDDWSAEQEGPNPDAGKY